MEERLQKLLSAAGICSRRTAEAYITAGRVWVNGEVAKLGSRADPDLHEITVDGLHYNELGFYWITEGLYKFLKETVEI